MDTQEQSEPTLVSSISSENGNDIVSSEYYFPPGVQLPTEVEDGESFWAGEGVEGVKETVVREQSVPDIDVSRAAAGKLEAAVEASKLVWEIAKSGVPRTAADGAAASILSPSDTEWSNYAAAKEFASPGFRYSLKDCFGNEITGCVFRIIGTYHGVYSGKSAEVRKGQYLPEVSVIFDHVWANFGCSFNGSVELSKISNVGPVDGPIVPFLHMTVKFKFANPFKAEPRGLTCKIRGDKGFAGLV